MIIIYYRLSSKVLVLHNIYIFHLVCESKHVNEHCQFTSCMHVVELDSYLRFLSYDSRNVGHKSNLARGPQI